MTMPVLEIPELLLAVLSHLDAPSLVLCSVVCRAWHEPATELRWARVQDLGYLVDKSISVTTLEHFKTDSFRRLCYQPFPELVVQPVDQEVPPEPSPFDQALDDFKQLPVDWLSEAEVLKRHTQHITHLRLFTGSSSLFGLLILHLLQKHYPTILQGIFPRLTTLTFDGSHYAPMISRSITTLPTLRQITFETSTYGRSLHSWILACQPAINLVSYTIKHVGSPEDNPGGLIDFPFPGFGGPRGSAILYPFISGRLWKHISLPGALVEGSLFSALASHSSLETLTITGSLRLLQGAMGLRGRSFESLHTLRLIDVANAKAFFERITLYRVRNLELGYKPESKGVNHDCPISYFTTIVQSCPNASSIKYTVDNKVLGDQEFVDLFPESMFESLLAFGSLEQLVVRVPHKTSICLSDEFLDRAAQAWPHLRELNLDPSHSSKTQLTLQGLAPLARHCPKLRSLQLGIQRNHVHTVFNAELYMREHGDKPGCALTYLDVGCPSVYSATTVSAFFSALFPHLYRIECPSSPNSDAYSRGDYFVWTQVTRTVRERDRDLDNLARMLRARDLTEKHGSDNSEFILSSIDDSDEDYWAYSGSEDESYSSDENE